MSARSLLLLVVLSANVHFGCSRSDPKPDELIHSGPADSVESPEVITPASPENGVTADFDPLVELIENTIEVDAWEDDVPAARAGGMGGGGGFGGRTEEDGLQEFESSLSMVINQTQTVHAGEEVPAGAFGGEVPADAESPQIAPQATTWKRSRIVPNTSRLMVGDEEELPLKGMQAGVQIDGFRARVVLDLFFFNEREEQLEGTFQLRLPNGASPYYFAFGEHVYKQKDLPADRPTFLPISLVRSRGSRPSDILDLRRDLWNEPKEARMVPREKASYAYRETVRRKVDPALVEWSGAGVFRSSIFPLTPNKLHRVVVGYDVDLLRVGGDFEYRLDLPEAVSQCVADVRVAEIEGVLVRVTPETQESSESGRSHFHFEDPEERTVTVRLTKPGSMLLRGSDPKTGPHFAATFRPQLPGKTSQSGASRGVFLVDTSLSSNPERFEVWLKLMSAILDNNRESLKQFAVLFFNVEPFWWQQGFVENTPQNVKSLEAFANTLLLEGATDLGRALAEASAPGFVGDPGNQPGWDLFLLSDGAATWGENDSYTLSHSLESGSAGALFSYTTGLAGTEVQLLLHLAREKGGAVFSVVGEAEIATASVAHRTRPWELVDLQIGGGEDLLLAGRPQLIYPGQSLLLSGRGTPDPDAEIVLTLRRGEAEQTVRTKLDHAIASELASRVYGQVAVGQLEELESATEEIATAYARHFRVTGRTCSLLMLETDEDYERFAIKPQEDPFVIKTNPASTVVAKALLAIGEALGNPKASFLAWLEKMEAMPGVEFQVSTGLRIVLDAMPASAFSVETPPLACRLRHAEGIPKKVRSQLRTGEIEYDLVIQEAHRRFGQAGPGDALLALSSLVEKHPGDGALARDVGYTAIEWGLGGEAYHLFRRVALSRPYEPQSYLALARCLTDLGKSDLALAYYEVAVSGQWDERFGEFRRIAELDYLRFLRRLEVGQAAPQTEEFAQVRRESLRSQAGVDQADLLVTIAWSTDGTDVDLHLTEPTGEKCYYQHPETKIGGRLTEDVTTGYGPEMYLLEQAAPGEYAIRVHYFSSDTNRTSTRTKVYATIYTGWGTKAERVTKKVVTLAEGKQMHDIATIAVKPASEAKNLGGSLK